MRYFLSDETDVSQGLFPSSGSLRSCWISSLNVSRRERRCKFCGILVTGPQRRYLLCLCDVLFCHKQGSLSPAKCIEGICSTFSAITSDQDVGPGNWNAPAQHLEVTSETCHVAIPSTRTPSSNPFLGTPAPLFWRACQGATNACAESPRRDL